MSTGISTLPNTVTPAKWQIVFYALGGATMLWSIVIWTCMPDSAASARFLTERQRIIAVKRVASNEIGVKNKHFNKKQALLAFYDPKSLLLFLCVFAAAIPNGVVNSFSTIIIRDMGFSTTRTTQLKSVGDATQVIALLIGGTVMLNVRNSRLAVATVANVLCTIAAACTAFLPRSNTWGRLVSFWLVNAQSVGFNVSLMTVSSNMGGYTHRSFSSAMLFTAYCWGNFAVSLVSLSFHCGQSDRVLSSGTVRGRPIASASLPWRFHRSLGRLLDQVGHALDAVGVHGPLEPDSRSSVRPSGQGQSERGRHAGRDRVREQGLSIRLLIAYLSRSDSLVDQVCCSRDVSTQWNGKR